MSEETNLTTGAVVRRGMRGAADHRVEEHVHHLDRLRDLLDDFGHRIARLDEMIAAVRCGALPPAFMIPHLVAEGTVCHLLRGHPQSHRFRLSGRDGTVGVDL